MSIRSTAWGLLIAVALLFPANAAPTTSAGQVSVAQLVEAMRGAAGDPMKAQVLTAYLAGLGETVGIMLAGSANYGAKITCKRAVAVDTKVVEAAIKRVDGGEPAYAETAATPLLVTEILDRAGCR
jgi:hypothetical protein